VKHINLKAEEEKEDTVFLKEAEQKTEEMF
jgi:hypothetical protein